MNNFKIITKLQLLSTGLFFGGRTDGFSRLQVPFQPAGYCIFVKGAFPKLPKAENYFLEYGGVGEGLCRSAERRFAMQQKKSAHHCSEMYSDNAVV